MDGSASSDNSQAGAEGDPERIGIASSPPPAPANTSAYHTMDERGAYGRNSVHIDNLATDTRVNDFALFQKAANSLRLGRPANWGDLYDAVESRQYDAMGWLPLNDTTPPSVPPPQKRRKITAGPSKTHSQTQNRDTPDSTTRDDTAQSTESMAIWDMQRLTESILNPVEADFDGTFTTDIENPMWWKPLSPNEARQALGSIHASTDLPTSTKKMFWWQEAGALEGKYLLMTKRRAFYGSATGLGKTAQAVTAWYMHAKEEQRRNPTKLQARTLLVVPTPHMIADWARAINDLPGASISVIGVKTFKNMIRVDGLSLAESSVPAGGNPLLSVCAVTFDALPNDGQRWVRNARWRTIIVDEIQWMKNFDGKRAHAVFEINAEYKIGLSATPITAGGWHDLRSVLAFMKTEMIESWEEDTEDDSVDPYAGGYDDYEEYRLSDKALLRRLRNARRPNDGTADPDTIDVLQQLGKAARWMIRHTRSSVNADDQQGVDHVGFKILTLASEYKDDAEKQLYLDKFSILLDKVKRNGSFSMEVLRLLRGTCFHLEYDLLADCITKPICDLAYTQEWELEDLDAHIAKQKASTQPVQGGVERWKGPKQRQLLQLLEKTNPKKCLAIVGDNAEQLVLTLLLQACGIIARSYHSLLLTKERQTLAQNFRNPEHSLRVLIISPQMGSTGINLQGAATIAYCMSIPFHCAASDQAFARLIRIGQKDYVHCIFDALQPSFDTL